ncbi:MAG: response regulator transcription factor [Lacinutrix sp.]|uniref:response regulator transcription factor n=1 Tax=Lacinutrix sp. TaxID=1937692 RepID=UPI0030AB5369
MVKLLVVDPHPIICKGLELLFRTSQNIKIIGSVSSGDAILDFLKRNPVDVVLTEIDLPNLNGLTAIRHINAAFPKVKIILYSAQPEEVYALSSIKAGANGFVSKSESLDALKDAIIKVNNGGLYLNKVLLEQLNKQAKGFKGNTYYKKLSTREVEVLKLLASGKRNMEIALELDINEKTVSTYRARLMKKLNVDNLIDLVEQSKNILL